MTPTFDTAQLVCVRCRQRRHFSKFLLSRCRKDGTHSRQRTCRSCQYGVIRARAADLYRKADNLLALVPDNEKAALPRMEGVDIDAIYRNPRFRHLGRAR